LDKNKKKRKKNVCVFYESINKIGGAGWAVLAGWKTHSSGSLGFVQEVVVVAACRAKK
jgi:hypothetical protein